MYYHEWQREEVGERNKNVFTLVLNLFRSER